MNRCMIVSVFAILVFCERSTCIVTAAHFSGGIVGGDIYEARSGSELRDQSVAFAGGAPVLVADRSAMRDGGEESAVGQAASSIVQSLQSAISSFCNGTQPGVVNLAQNAAYSVSSTVTIPPNCTINGNGAKVTATSSLVGNLISSIGGPEVHVNGPLTVNSASANLSTGKQSHTIEFDGVWHSSISDVSFTGSTHGELTLMGVSDFAARNLTFANASSAHGAMSPAMVIFNWVGGKPTQASTGVRVDTVRCVGSPTTTPGCILADGNYNHSGTPGQSNDRISVTNVTVESTTDDGVEYDHTAGTITEIRCGPGPMVNQCVFLRQTSRVRVDNVTCLGGMPLCVDIARVGDDDAEDNISVSHVTGTGMSASREGAVVRVRNTSTSAPLTNVTVDGVVAENSSNVGVLCLGPNSTGPFLQHIVFKNITSHDNKNDGMTIAFCQDVTITNAQIFNNNQAGAPCASVERAALRIANSNAVVVNGIRGYDDQAGKTQCYGLTVDGGSKGVSISGAEFRDDLSAVSGVRNESRDAYIVYRKNATATVTIGRH